MLHKPFSVITLMVFFTWNSINTTKVRINQWRTVVGGSAELFEGCRVKLNNTSSYKMLYTCVSWVGQFSQRWTHRLQVQNCKSLKNFYDVQFVPSYQLARNGVQPWNTVHISLNVSNCTTVQRYITSPHPCTSSHYIQCGVALRTKGFKHNIAFWLYSFM